MDMAIGDIIKSFVSWVFVVKIVCAASKILINGSMLYGVIQKKAGFMLPWLIFGMMEIVCVSIFTAILFKVKRSLKESYISIHQGLVTFLSLLAYGSEILH